jgi:hypothetical protein
MAWVVGFVLNVFVGLVVVGIGLWLVGFAVQAAVLLTALVLGVLGWLWHHKGAAVVLGFVGLMLLNMHTQAMKEKARRDFEPCRAEFDVYADKCFLYEEVNERECQAAKAVYDRCREQAARKDKV